MMDAMTDYGHLPLRPMRIAEPVRCGECGAIVEGYTEYGREVVTRDDLVPEGPGGRLVPLPPDERVRPLRTATPCGHRYDGPLVADLGDRHRR